MGKLAVPILAALALVLAAPAMAGPFCGGASTQSVEADAPAPAPVDTASTVESDSSG